MKTIYKYLNLLFLIVGSFNIALAQQVTNVRVQQEGEQIIITYDLDKTAYVRVYVATGQSEQYTLLKAVTGNVGKGVQPGTNRRITWTPLDERTEFVAQNVRFKVSPMPGALFWVSPTKAVVFSPGNLQYHPSTHTWRFAPYQWEYIGEANENISPNYNGWIDLFGWGTGDNPTKSSKNAQDYQIFVDWGINKIGDDAPNTWRTLSANEWKYLFMHTRCTMVRVNGVLGFMLLPDDFSIPVGWNIKMLGSGKMLDDNLYFNDFDYTQNKYSTYAFAQLEAKGCVFFPCAGQRGSSSVNDVGSYGFYWSASPYNSDRAWSLFFHSTSASTYHWGHRQLGLPVRLVQDLK